MSAQKIAKFSVEPRDYTEARQSTPEVRRIVPEIRGLHDGEDGHEGEDGHDVSCPYKGEDGHDGLLVGSGSGMEGSQAGGV